MLSFPELPKSQETIPNIKRVLVLGRKCGTANKYCSRYLRIAPSFCAWHKHFHCSYWGSNLRKSHLLFQQLLSDTVTIICLSCDVRPHHLLPAMPFRELCHRRLTEVCAPHPHLFCYQRALIPATLTSGRASKSAAINEWFGRKPWMMSNSARDAVGTNTISPLSFCWPSECGNRTQTHKRTQKPVGQVGFQKGSAGVFLTPHQCAHQTRCMQCSNPMLPCLCRCGQMPQGDSADDHIKLHQKAEEAA